MFVREIERDVMNLLSINAIESVSSLPRRNLPFNILRKYVGSFEGWKGVKKKDQEKEWTQWDESGVQLKE